MAENVPQSYANHGRLDPLFHFFLAPASAAMLLALLWRLYAREGKIFTLFLICWIATYIVLIFKMRLYALKVQDRVIRLEERVRLAALLPEPLRGRLGELTVDQLIALRFASDAEVADLAKSALDSKLKRDDIKKMIKNWRPDHWRV